MSSSNNKNRPPKLRIGKYSWYKTTNICSNETKMDLEPGGLFTLESGQSLDSDFIASAKQFVASTFGTKLKTLNSRAILLSAKEMPNGAGFKVSFQQQIRQFSVHNGGIQVFLRKRVAQDGIHLEVYRYTASLIEAKPAKEYFGITKATAKKQARLALTAKLTETSRLSVTDCRKELNPHRGVFQPIYRLQLEQATNQNGRIRRFEVILRGQDGKLVFARELGGCLPSQVTSEQRARQASAVVANPQEPNTGTSPDTDSNGVKTIDTVDSGSNAIPASSLVDLPLANKPIANQFRTVALNLDIMRKVKGNRVLANPWFEVYSTPRRSDNKVDWQLVGTTPKDNSGNGGTFEWDEASPQAKGVVLYFTLTEEFLFLSQCGLKVPAGSIIKCYPDHPWNPNNATFFGKELILQIGVGNGSMAEHIVYDLIVVLHEGAHAYVQFMRDKDHWLYGPQGQALNEAIADIVATTMHYLFWLKHGLSLDNEISLDKLFADKGVIGSFALKETGFRQLENDLVYPTDLKSDQKVHENCKIVGAAMFHMFKYCLSKLSTTDFKKALFELIKEICVLFTTAIPMLPTNRVTFSDWRIALEDADALLFNKAHHAAIENGFSKHGINR